MSQNGKRDGDYRFDKLPENIRQIGEPPMKNRIYIEDYVMTYMHQIFRKSQDEAIVILVGKRGEKETDNAGFAYGGIEIAFDISSGIQNFNSETWDKIYELIGKHFQGAEVLGWGCGVRMWNSQIDSIVRQIQEKYFAKEGMILFLEDLNEREEKVFCWQSDKLAEQDGYVIYYEKNPQMQDYMLLGQPKSSFEASYEDKITATVREIVSRKGEQGGQRKTMVYGAGVLLALLAVLGGNLLIQSTKKIDSLEKTIETLSNAATNVTEAPKDKTDKAKDKTAKKGDKASASATTSSTPELFATENNQTPSILSTPAPKGEQTPLIPTTDTPKGKQSSSPAGTAVPEKKQSPSPVKTPVPAGKPASPSPPARAAASPPPASSPIPKPSNQAVQTVRRTAASYVVQSGDTLSQIVWRQYHTLSCMEMVKKANKIKDGDKIKEGQVIYLPAYPD